MNPYRDELAAAQYRRAFLESERDELKAELERSRAEIAHLQSRSSFIADQQQRITFLETELDQRKTEIERSRAEIANLQSQGSFIANQQQRIAFLEAELNKQRAEIERTKSHVGTLAREASYVEQQKRRMASLESQIASLRQQRASTVAPAQGLARDPSRNLSRDHSVRMSTRRQSDAFLLSVFLGLWGVDRIFTGHTPRALLKLFTFGGFGVMWIADIFIIGTGSMVDQDNLLLYRPRRGRSKRSQAVAFLLSVFFGFLGMDQFYLGQTRLGLLKLFTVGGFGIWALFDILWIGMGLVEDVDGNSLS